MSTAGPGSKDLADIRRELRSLRITFGIVLIILTLLLTTIAPILVRLWDAPAGASTSAESAPAHHS